MILKAFDRISDYQLQREKKFLNERDKRKRAKIVEADFAERII